MYDAKEKLEFVMKTLDDEPQLFFYKYIFQSQHSLSGGLRERFKGSSFIFVVDIDSLEHTVREFYYDYPNNELFLVSNKDQYTNKFINKRRLKKWNVQDEIILSEEVNTNRIKRFYLIKDFKVISIYNKTNDDIYEVFNVQ